MYPVPVIIDVTLKAAPLRLSMKFSWELIIEYKKILKSKKELMKVIKNELNLIKEKFSVPRRTKIIDAVLNYDIEETIQGLIEESFENSIYSFIPFESVESQWKTSELDQFLKESFQFNKEFKPVIDNDKSLGVEEIKEV